MSNQNNGDLGPWNPGISSKLPPEARRLATIFRPENVVFGLDVALERSAFTGLEPEDLIAFRPERLIVHELLIRITGDFSVPDGQRYADLGINFRTIVDTILKRDILPTMADVIDEFEALRRELSEEVVLELNCLQPKAIPTWTTPSGDRGFFRWLGLSRRSDKTAELSEPDTKSEGGIVAEWHEESIQSLDPKRRRLCRALATVTAALAIRHGRIPIDTHAIEAITLDCLMNDHGSALVGQIIEPLIANAVTREGYRLLPIQSEPIVMNVKGASAAGKSTLRPLQRQLAQRLGINWADFALISPDIWRKYLLDYDSLGPFQRYAGTLTGHELKIVDQKLDRYMAEKAARGAMSHLLIDRFRFDSFAETEGGEQGAKLLTRFGATVYMFFVITPPEATVERAWKRGLEVGRFKAVDDLLHHNVEAFTGMPDLFFTWALREDKKVHYEFLDNSVPQGHQPRTVAFGWNGDMTLMDIKSFLNVDRYKCINIDARTPDQVYPDTDATMPSDNTAFLKRCAQHLSRITIAHQGSGRIIARLKNGHVCWIDPEAFEQAVSDPDSRAGLDVLVPEQMRTHAERAERPVFVDTAKALTLGTFGSSFPQSGGS